MPRVDLDHVAPIRASVTDAVEELLDELPRAGRITFRELTGGLVERLEVVVRFLAVLELYKQGLSSSSSSATSATSRSSGSAAIPQPSRAERGCTRWPWSTGTKDDIDMNADARAIEAILMVAEDPVEPQLLAQLLEVPVKRVEELCAELQAAYDEDERGFILVRVAGGYRFQSHPDLAPYVERFVLEGQSARLSAAALETLAIVAYKQPVSRAQVSAIRGVNVDGVMRTLQQRGFIDEIARDPGPGLAVLYGTTTLVPRTPRSRLARRRCRRSASSCPARKWSRHSSRAFVPNRLDAE